MLSPYLRTNWIDKLDPFPPEIADRTHWQHVSGIHSSESRRMLGSIMIFAQLHNGALINIRHIGMEGSSQWLIGRDVTNKCDIIHSSGNYLKLTKRTQIPLKNVDMHSYVHSYIFLEGTNNSCSTYKAKLFCATGNIHDPTNHYPWSKSRKLLAKYTNMFADIRTSVTLKHYFNATTCGQPKLKNISIVLFLQALIVLKHLNPNKPAKYHSATSTNHAIKLCA